MDRIIGSRNGSLTALALGALTLGIPGTPAAAQTAPRYSITELQGVPTRINDSGQVSGWVNTGGVPHAAVYSNGAWRDLGVVSGDQLSVLYDLNGAGAGVGFSFAALQPPIPPDTSADNRWQAILAPAGATAVQALTAIAPDSFGYAINDSGTIVGCLNRYDDVFPDPHRAYVYSNGTLTDLHALLSSGGAQGFDFTCARDVNGAGHVVGEFQPQNSPSRGFLYRNGAVRTLVQGSSFLTNARAISSGGRVVGEGRLAGFTADQAMAYDVASGAITSLGLESVGASASRPNDVNASGAVVGLMTLVTGERGFLASGGRIYDLNDLIPAGSGWVVQEAFSINARGQIVGRGYRTSDPGVARYFLMDASAPAPSISGLITQVKALQQAGFLSKGNANALLSHLTTAECKLNARQSRQAVNALEAFVRHVDVLICTRKLSAAKGQPLIDEANRIIALLGR